MPPSTQTRDSTERVYIVLVWLTVPAGQTYDSWPTSAVMTEAGDGSDFFNVALRPPAETMRTIGDSERGMSSSTLTQLLSSVLQEWAQVQCCFTDVQRDHKSQLDQQWLKLDGQDHFDLRPQKRGCLLGTGDMRGRGRENEGATADTARKRPERPWTAARTMEVLRPCPPLHCAATSALRSCCFNCRTGQSHKDNVRCAAVEEQPEAKEVQLSQPSSTSVPAHYIFWATWGSSSTSFLLISPGTLLLLDGAGMDLDIGPSAQATMMTNHDYPGWSALTSDNRRDSDRNEWWP